MTSHSIEKLERQLIEERRGANERVQELLTKTKMLETMVETLERRNRQLGEWTIGKSLSNSKVQASIFYIKMMIQP